ncbi:helix-turn-helix domain-containing protein [Oceanobacillus sp. CFH 90083]|uniref:helix-turn-helix domain-containing protein n=1 Tax=Oceanobacillus sp. CFH 90083 TaxID=2592336 RepID=UPI00128DCB2E|nr:helix-turn-helix domain-containing protein [Oceanobacillus sp. CFH 90083]
MELNIGANIKKRRRELGFTQQELASGICTQAQISNIEKGQLNPSCLVLFNISQKLLVDMNYFFGSSPEKNNGHFNEIKNMINQLKEQRNYASIKYIAENELQQNTITSYEQRYLQWHQAISDYYLSNRLEESVQFLKELIVEDENDDDILLNINIQISIAIMYQEERNYESALRLYEQALDELNKVKGFDDFYTELKLLFGLSQTLTYLGKYNDSKRYCLKAVSICTNKNTLHFLPDCYYQLGNNLIKLNQIEDGIKYIQIALTLFKIKENTTMVNTLNEKLESLVEINNK